MNTSHTMVDEQTSKFARPQAEAEQAVTPGQPVFRKLSRDEIDELLTKNTVGRIAYAFKDRVDIEPVNYAYADGWIYGRTSPGSKLHTLSHNRWVAFEIDESRAVFDWSSVIVRGTMYFLTSESPTGDYTHSFAHGIELLDRIVPGTLKGNDPVPFRNVVFRIHLDEVTGREAKPAQSNEVQTPATSGS